MTIAYFDCFSGASGDMIVGALIHAGADTDELRTQLAGLKLDGYTLDIQLVQKQGFAAVRCSVELTAQADQPHRHLKTIKDIIGVSNLSAQVKDQAQRVFTRLAEAEARVHGTTVDKVHFHEVGAVDAIVDVVAAVVALELLGVDRILCSPVPTGNGTVTCDHGVMPVPAPATAELLRGVPLASTDEMRELTTPTGAAILTTLASSFGPLPSMTVQAIGYGAGSREGRTRPNVLRVLVGKPLESADEAQHDEIMVLATQLDDTTPEVVGHCMDLLISKGALDAYAQPIHMKKSRCGVLLTVLCDPSRVPEFERLIFAETTTFGIRRHRVTRTKLRRRHESVSTRFGPIGMKIGWCDEVETASPEYDDCKAAAQQHRVALRMVMDAARIAWQARTKRADPPDNQRSG